MVANIYESKDMVLFNEVQKLINGNYDSYEQVYELSKKYIYKIINDVVQNHYTTEDLMQETYLQVYRKISTLKEAKAFYVWAGRIATNLTLRHIQKYRKEVPYAQVNDDEEESGTIFDKAENDHMEFIPETVLTNTEQQRIIAEILEGLSPEQKLCVQYYYYEEMSVSDIAELMQCSTGTVKSRLNYARKSLKEAINTFEVRTDTKLYSLAVLPVFFLAFKKAADAIVFAGVSSVGVGAAAVAGGVAMEKAAVGGGAVAGGSAATGGGAVAGSSVAVGSGVTAATSTAGAGFLSTVVGKVAIVVTAVCVSGGAAAVTTEVSQKQMVDKYGYELTFEDAKEEIYAMGETFGETYYMIEPEAPVTEEYQNITELLGEETVIADTDLSGIDEEYLEAVDNLTAEMLRYQEALEYSLTDEQYAYIEDLMAAYIAEAENYILQGQQYATLAEADATGVFESTYLPQIIELMNEEAEVVGKFADFYSQSEVKAILANYTATDLENMLNNGGGIGDLIAPDLSEDMLNELITISEELFSVVEKFMVLYQDMANDPALSVYFTENP